MHDYLLPALDNGSIRLVKGEIKEFRGAEIVLTNGNTVKDVDHVFFCTGYDVCYYKKMYYL